MNMNIKKYAFVFLILLFSCHNSEKKVDRKTKIPSVVKKNDEIVKDMAGNQYGTIKVNNKIWFSSNLKTTKYSNGESIPNIKKDKDWGAAEIGAYCKFDNNDKYYSYGYLYNLYAIIDKRGLCPKGWHVATSEDWNSAGENIWSKKLFNNKILGWRNIADDNNFVVKGDFAKDADYNSFCWESKFSGGGSAIYWTSDFTLVEDDDTEQFADSVILGHIVFFGSIGEGPFLHRKNGFPCRCVKDEINK